MIRLYPNSLHFKERMVLGVTVYYQEILLVERSKQLHKYSHDSDILVLDLKMNQ